MKDFLKWCLENQEIIKDVLRLILSLGAFVYATVIHWKSKKRLTVLEAESEVKLDLIKTIQDLRNALEKAERRNDGK